MAAAEDSDLAASDSEGWSTDSEDESAPPAPPTAAAVEKLLCEQLCLADIILLNKIDMVDEPQLVQLTQTVGRLNPTAAVLRCDHGQVSLDGVLKVKAFSVARALETCRATIPERSGHGADDRSGTRHLHQLFGALAFERNETLDELAFTDWLESVLRRFSEQIYRIKGLVRFSRVDGRSLVQCVNSHAEIDRVDESLHGGDDHSGDGSSKVVLIGQVDEIALELRNEFDEIKS